MISSSLKESSEILQQPPTLWPHNWTTAHYAMILSSLGLERALLNSVIVAPGRVLLVVVIAVMTGYTLAKLRFPGRRVLFAIVLGLMMVPMQLSLIPLFLLTERYGLIDTYAALIIPGAVNSFSIFLMRQAFLSVPNDYIDAAIVDGAGHIRILYQIALPMVMPMVLTLALVNAFWSWNDFLWPFIVIVREEMSTLPVALARFSRMIMGVGGTTRAGPVMAAATLTALPIMVIFLIFQRRFVEALTMAGLKG
jgi:multiple sugar transport system permease protein